MSGVLGSGCHALFQASTAKLGELLLRQARDSRAISVIERSAQSPEEAGLQRFGFYPTAIALDVSGDVVNVSGLSGSPPVSVSRNVAAISGVFGGTTGTLQFSSPLIDTLSTGSFRPAVVPRMGPEGAGTVTVGFDLVEEDAAVPTLPPTLPEELAAFSADIRTAAGRTHDWATALSRPLVLRLLDAGFEEPLSLLVADVSGGSAAILFADVRVTSFEWGDPITFRGHGVLNGVGFVFSGTLRISISEGGIPSVEADVPERTISVDFWDHWFNSAWSWGFYSRLTAVGLEVADRARSAIFSIASGAPRAPFGYFPPGSAWTARHLEMNAEALILRGDAENDFQVAPRMADSAQGRLQIAVVAESACVDGGAFAHAQWTMLSIRNLGDASLSIAAATLVSTNVPAPELRIISVGEHGDGRSIFHPAYLPSRLEPGGAVSWALNWSYADRSGRVFLKLSTNDPAALVHSIAIDLVAAGATRYRVEPPAPDIRVANTAGGGPRARLVGCRIVTLRREAAEFSIRNEGVEALAICAGSLDDPAGVFAVPALNRPPRLIMPGREEPVSILFYPKAAMTTYNATARFTTSAGEIVVPLTGRVEAVPQLGDNGGWIDLNINRACIPLEALCGSRRLFGPLPDPRALLVMLLTVEGVMPDAVVEFHDSTNAVHARDESGAPRRRVALEFAPSPKGAPMPLDPCGIRIAGLKPSGAELARVDVEGRVLRFERELDQFSTGPAAVVAGRIYVGASDGVRMYEHRDGKAAWRGRTIETVKATQLAGDGSMLAAAGGSDVVHFAIGSDGFATSRSTATIGRPACSLAIAGGTVHVADGQAIWMLRPDGRRLAVAGRVEMPGGANWLLAGSGRLWVAGDRTVSLMAFDADGRARIESAIRLDGAVDDLRGGDNCVLAASAGEVVALAAGSDGVVRAVCRYPKGHWLMRFSPGPRRDLLLSRGARRRIGIWTVEPASFDLSRFSDATALQYKPARAPDSKPSAGAPRGHTRSRRAKAKR
ncbi:MAG: hypothetical protein JNL66_14145 [Alphaproteobacteria bacterium]|nr:hypothetical protein [Alphaproteobacteria bacterium]